MAKKTASKDLLKRATTKPIRNVCWFDKVKDKEARDFVAEVIATIKRGDYVNISEVARILHEHFDVTIGIGRVSLHIVKCECSCFRR